MRARMGTLQRSADRRAAEGFCLKAIKPCEDLQMLNNFEPSRGHAGHFGDSKELQEILGLSTFLDVISMQFLHNFPGFKFAFWMSFELPGFP